jgi:hypothetical protein
MANVNKIPSDALQKKALGIKIVRRLLEKELITIKSQLNSLMVQANAFNAEMKKQLKPKSY